MKITAARLKRLPRAAYWVAGAVLACTGALGARFFADTFPLRERVGIWLAGAGIVFLGLCVVSLGSRAHLDPKAEEPEEEAEGAYGLSGRGQGDEQPKPTKENGAGEGNRTLA